MNSRAAFPVRCCSCFASRNCRAIFRRSRGLRAKPNTYSTRCFSHQAISSSRQKPASARRMMRTCGQRWRICRTRRSTSSTLPALAS